MLSSLPDNVPVSVIANTGSTQLENIHDVELVGELLRDSCLLFSRREATDNVARLAAEFVKYQEEGFLGTASAVFRVCPEKDFDVATYTEIYMLVVAKPKDLVCYNGEDIEFYKGPIIVHIYWRMYEAMSQL
jgi:hypothetical protein